MATRPRKNTPIETEEPPETAPPDPQEIATEARDLRTSESVRSIEEVLDYLEDNEGEFSVRQLNPESREYTTLSQRMKVGVMDGDPAEYIRREFGGGKWEILFFVRADGMIKNYTKRRIEVSGAVPPGDWFKRNQPAAPAAGGEIESVVRTVLEKVHPAASGSSSEIIAMMMTQMQSMMTQQTQILTALLSKPAQENNIMQMISAMAALEKMRPQETMMLKPAMEMLSFTAKILQERYGGDDEPPENPIVGFMSSLLAGVATRMGGAQPALPAAPQSAQQQPGANGEAEPGVVDVPPEPEQQPETTLENMSITWLIRANLPSIIVRIEEGATPADIIALFKNPFTPFRLSPAQKTELLTVLSGESWRDDLFGNKALIAKHDAWFAQLREELLLWLKPK